MVEVKKFKKSGYVSKPEKWPVILSLINSKDQKYFRITKESKYLYVDMLPYIYPEGDGFRSFIDDLRKIDKNASSPEQFLREATIEKNKFNTVMKQIYGKTVLNVRIEPDNAVSPRKRKKNYVIIRKIYWKKFKEALVSDSKEDVSSLFQEYNYIMKCNFGFLYDTLMLRNGTNKNYINSIRKHVKSFLKPHIKKIMKNLNNLYKLDNILISLSHKKQLGYGIVYATGLKFQLDGLKRDIRTYDFISAYSKLRVILLTICKAFLVISGKDKGWKSNWPFKKEDREIMKEITSGIGRLDELKESFIKKRKITSTKSDPHEDNYLHLRFYNDYSYASVHQRAYVIPGLSVLEVYIFNNEITRFVEATNIITKEYLKVIRSKNY